MLEIKQNRRWMATAASPELYDVAVVGGGPAGLSFVAALRILTSLIRVDCTERT